MSKQTINIGASPNDGTGTPLRTSFDYTNQNFTELYNALGGGVGLPGATTQVIFNDGGTNLAGDAGLVYNKTTDALTVAGLVTAGSATITGAATVGTTLGVTGQSTLTGNVGVGVTPSAWGAGLKALQVGATGYGALFDFNNDVIAMSANLLWTGSAYNRISASSKYALAYYQDIGGSHQWSMSSAAGTNAVAPTMNTLMTLNANGNLVLKGGTAAANGVGVTFPATQVAASDANTLDDYEEGTWVGTVTGSTTNPTTPVTETGRYTKIGRQVNVQIWFFGVDTTGASGEVLVTGLPFANASGNSAVPGSAGSQTMANFTGTLISQIGSGGTGFELYSVNSGASMTNATHNPGAGRRLSLSSTYQVA